MKLVNCRIARLHYYKIAGLFKQHSYINYWRLKMKVKAFEDLQVWQDARAFVKSIYELTSLNNFNKDFGLKDQIQRLQCLL
jgi:hypothetical protein